MHQATTSYLTIADGSRLSVWDYRETAIHRADTVVLLVHGLGEHQGRYAQVAQHLTGWGHAVRSYDQVGHGLSTGVRGGITRPMQLVEHLLAVVQATRTQMSAEARLIVLGHSLGGLVAARTAMVAASSIDGLVLSSPALDLGLSTWQRVMLATVPYITPNVRFANGLNPDELSHDAQVVTAYREDPLCHDRISARLAHFIWSQGAVVRRYAPLWSVKTLLLYSGQDKCVNPSGSQRFVQLAPKKMVSSSVFHSLKHEIFNEADSDLVLNLLRTWLGSARPLQPSP